MFPNSYNKSSKLKIKHMTTRRSLLKQMALLTTGSLMVGDAAWALSAKSGHKIGLQLYTLRDALAKDPASVIAKVAGLGFQEVETFGYNGKFFGMDAAAYKALLTQHGLTAPSGHYMYGNFGNRQVPGTVLHGWDKAIEDAAIVGQEYMTVAYLMPEERKSLDDYKQIAADLNKAGAACRKAGIKLCYHNHDFEFQSVQGTVPYSILLNNTDPALVQFEMDLYWTVKAGQDPVALFNQNPGRIPLWHVKDMDKTDKKFFTEVGNGSIDFAGIFKQAKASGMTHFFVEQDACPGDPFDSIKQSIGYIKKNLVRYV
jgi:sugar phosphate isomerase/epimerase